LHARPAAESQRPPGQLVADALGRDGNARRQPLDDDRERRPVRLPGSEVSDHRFSLLAETSPLFVGTSALTGGMWQACVRLALGQEGLITLDQALSLGCPANCFKGHVARGDVERILPRVYRLSAAAESPRQRLRAGCLWGGEGTAASH